MVEEGEKWIFYFHICMTLGVILLMGNDIIRGIRKNKSIELRFKQMENNLTAFLDNLPDKAWIMDNASCYVLVNQKFSEDFGISKESVKGKTHFDVWNSETAEQFAADDKTIFETKEPLKVERPIVGENGNQEWVEIIKSPIFDGEEQIVGSVGIARDITESKCAKFERKELESQLRQSQKMEAIGTLAGGIAHDFNNILAAVIGYTEMALEEISENHPVEERMKRVLKAGYRGKDLVNQILTFSRQREKEQVPIEPGLIIEDALKLLRPLIPSTISIQCDVKASNNMMMADPGQIHQILMNLCTNAAHAMRENGGVLHIVVEDIMIESCGRDTQYTDLEPGPYVVLTVMDSGHGLDAALAGKIFEPFFTTKKSGEGTGLGLSVVNGIVKGLKGSIRVDSQPGKGACFKVYLPSTGKEEKIVKQLNTMLPMGDERILFVDDEELIVDLAKEMLEGLGYRVDAFCDSLSALEFFKRDGEHIQMVITDQNMPHMSGIQLSKAIKKIRPQTPIVLCTGYCEGLSKEKAMALGMADYMMKPFNKKGMALSIRKVLDIHYP